MTAMEIAAVAQPIVAFVIGAGQIAIVAWGIRAIIGANRDRAAGAAEAARRAEERHIETMAALEAQRRRADQRHAEAARRVDERHAEAARRAEERHVEVARRAEERHVEAMAALEAQRRQADQRHAEAGERHVEAMAALAALIDRTAP